MFVISFCKNKLRDREVKRGFVLNANRSMGNFYIRAGSLMDQRRGHSDKFFVDFDPATCSDSHCFLFSPWSDDNSSCLLKKKKINIWLRILKDSQAAMSSLYSKRDMIWNRLSSRMTLTFETRHWIKILFLGKGEGITVSDHGHLHSRRDDDAFFILEGEWT